MSISAILFLASLFFYFMFKLIYYRFEKYLRYYKNTLENVCDIIDISKIKDCIDFLKREKRLLSDTTVHFEKMRLISCCSYIINKSRNIKQLVLLFPSDGIDTYTFYHEIGHAVAFTRRIKMGKSPYCLFNRHWILKRIGHSIGVNYWREKRAWRRGYNIWNAERKTQIIMGNYVDVLPSKERATYNRTRKGALKTYRLLAYAAAADVISVILFFLAITGVFVGI